jgi:hypothetical protein
MSPTTTFNSRQWVANAFVIGTIAALGLVGCVAGASTLDNANAMINFLAREPPTDKGAVERLLGVKLELISTDWVKRYSAQRFQLEGITIEHAEFSESGPGSNLGQRLLLTLGGACITGRQILVRYPNMAAGRASSAPVPLNGSPPPELGWYEQLPWGRLSLSFDVQSDCLRHVAEVVTKG